MRCFPGGIGAGLRTFYNSGQMDELVSLLYIYISRQLLFESIWSDWKRTMRGGGRTVSLGGASQNAV